MSLRASGIFPQTLQWKRGGVWHFSVLWIFIAICIPCPVCQNQDGQWRAAVVLWNMLKIRGWNQHTCIKIPVSVGHSLGMAPLGPPLRGLPQVQVKMLAGPQSSQGSAWWGYGSKLTQWCFPGFTSLLALGWTHPCVFCPVGLLLYWRCSSLHPSVNGKAIESVLAR